MKKSKTPSFILTLSLAPEPWQINKLNTDFKVCVHIYNSLRREMLNKYGQMIKTCEYQYWLNQYRISKGELRKEASYHLADIQKAYKLTEYGFHSVVKKYQRYFYKNINSMTAQKLASQLWKAFDKLIFNDGKKVHYKRYDEFDSIEGKNNASGITFKNNELVYNKTKIKVLISQNHYVQEALTNRVKYCRIERKFVRGRTKYYLQLILEGLPPSKNDVVLSKNRVGLDIGPQTLAICSDRSVKLVEFADKVQNIENQLRCINRAMDRSRRAMNPGFFNADGAYINTKSGEKREWALSNHYKKLSLTRKELYRKQAAVRKQQHYELAKYVISLGTQVYIEKMNFKALQKRVSKTERSDKTGKFKPKKRFGKSLANKAPAMFVSILEQKLKNNNGALIKINTTEMKASQYRHDTKTYKKSKLSERTKDISDHTVQRDLYSAFLIMNTDSSLSKPDQERCDMAFNNFAKLHDVEIERLKKLKRVPTSMGLKKIA